MSQVDVQVYCQIDGEDRLVGRLFGHRRRSVESATFSYDGTWLRSRDAYALSPQLPLEAGSFQTPVGQALFGCFTDCAPDRWGRNLIRRYEVRRARRERETPRSFGEMDYLLGVRDDARQGALRFRLAGEERFVADDQTGVPHLIDLPELLGAQADLERRPDEADHALRLLLRAGSSLGGARPKAHVIDADGRLAIAKFPRQADDMWDVCGWESVALTLARHAGIDVPESDLIEVARRNVLLVRRFDRDGDRRIAYASAMTMLEAADGDVRSYLDIADRISAYSAAPKLDLAELWRRIAFSVLISNTDDHLRNHGFLHTGRGGWMLSPAFDLNPTPDAGAKHLSLTIDYDDDRASVETLMSVAPEFGLDRSAAVAVIGEVEEAVSEWRSVASALGLPKGQIDEMESAFEHSERRAARTLR